jgi:S1-C subfamily serine protease
MKQPILSYLLSEKVCRKLLLYILLPILALGLGYLGLAEGTRDDEIELPFRVPPRVLPKNLEVFKKASPAVVLIETFDENKRPKARGTGFFVSDKGHLITNHHVIRGAYSARIKTTEGKAYPVKGLIAKDPDVDIAKLAVDVEDRDFSALEFASILPCWGDKAVVLGHPKGQELTLSTGVVRAGRADGRISAECIKFEISAPVSPGSSGSPVLNTEGEVIGIAQACKIAASYEKSNEGVTYAVAVSNVLCLKSEEKLISLSEYADVATAREEYGIVNMPVRDLPTAGFAADPRLYRRYRLHQ